MTNPDLDFSSDLSTKATPVAGDLLLGADSANSHNVVNIDVASLPISTATTTALGLKVDKTTTVNGHALSSNVTVTASDVGLGNVDNTSDSNKPVSAATQVALNAKANDSAVVHNTGNETVAGIKTFSSSPIVPTPTTDMQASTKKYVDDQVATATIPDATTLVKGKIKLAGDLGGTADLPTVPGLAGKQATLVSGTNIKTINSASILGSGDLVVSGGHTIEDEGTPLTSRSKLNFVGAGVTVTDGGAGPDSTIVTIPGATGGGDMLLGTVQEVTAEKKFDKDTLSTKGTSTGKVIISNENTSANDYTATLQAKTGMLALTSDITGTNSGTNTGDTSFNVKAYGAVGDGTTDDTTSVNNTIAAAVAAGGGEVFFPTGTYKCLGAIVIPYTGTNLPYQKPLRLRGTVSSWNGYWTGINLPLTGSILDFRYNGGTGPLAKIDTRGVGFLEIDHLVMKSGGSDDYPFIYTTNTTLFIHHCAFSGNAAHTGVTCVQDAIILGGQNEGNIQTNADDAAFQGYGTRLSNNFYEKIRRAVTFGCQANNVVVENETVSKNCGSAGTIDAPFYFTGKNYGNIIRGGTIEIESYKYAAVMIGVCEQNMIDTMGIYDNQAYTVGGVYFDTPSVYNAVVLGHFDPSIQTSFMAGPSLDKNTLFSAGRFALTSLSQGLILDTLQLKGNKTITTTTAAVPTGGNMTLDTGSGGSYLNYKAYAHRFYDYQGNERTRIDTNGKIGAGMTAPTAFVHLKAGTATANTGPLKFTAGTSVSTPETGLMEFDGTNYYITI